MTSRLLNLWKKLGSVEYRRAFAAAQTSAIAAQIASMRHRKGWTQHDLAEAAGMAQSRISLLEDPDYDKMTLSTLRRVAEAFDVVLSVRFVPFSEHVRWSLGRSPEDMAPASFSEDRIPVISPRKVEVSAWTNSAYFDRATKPVTERRTFDHQEQHVTH